MDGWMSFFSRDISPARRAARFCSLGPLLLFPNVGARAT